MSTRAKCIMIQGTMSNAGKSILAAGLCRVFKQDGYRVAPFKSQNMALNSYITGENLEMGRAQVVQAQACGIEPVVAMNPILLKPTTDMGSQVIVNGEVIGTMQAVDYFRHKKDYIPVIKKAYDTLAAAYDIVVIEGAGSPAEINLKQDDIVNMGMAKLADAPVLLVGDIDRGGVFAQLIGTVMLLEPEEQERIQGLVINKFRGDVSILEPGLRMLEEKSGKDVLGIVPYMDVDIEDEDSLAECLQHKAADRAIDIAVIRLPKISNFTDFQALSMETQVSVRYVDRVAQLGTPDAILLPGTKNTLADLRWLRKSGLEGAILRCKEKGVFVAGICGGYQMLGMDITDGCNAEGGGSLRGMGILPVHTVFEPEKTRTRKEGTTRMLCGTLGGLSGKRVSGYEIHMGVSTLEPGQSCFITFEDGEDGCIGENAFGSYLHGLFDEEDFRHAWIRMLCERKGISYEEAGKECTYAEYKEQQFDKLADQIRKSLDMDRIYRIMGIERDRQRG